MMSEPGLREHKRMLGPLKDERDYVGGNSYFLRDLQLENEEAKQPQRERVLAHVLAHHPRGRVAMFSLPGPNWAFENMVERERPGSRFVAVERHWHVLQGGLWRMPGSSRLAEHQEFHDGDLRGVASDQSQVWWSWAGTFLQVRAGLKWYRRCQSFSAAWLDFSAPLSREVVAALREFPDHLDRRRRAVPFAVTLLKARESTEIGAAMSALAPGGSTLARRVAMVGALLQHPAWEFELADQWQYASAGGAPMCVIAVVARKRP